MGATPLRDLFRESANRSGASVLLPVFSSVIARQSSHGVNEMHCCSRSVATGANTALLATVLVWLAGCTGSASDREIEVQGTDYAFTVPDTIAPGRATLKFTNSGRVRHELVLARLKPGVTLAEVMRAQEEGKSPDDFLIGGGVLFANAGETDPIGLSVDFKDGERYSMVCFFRDSADAPPHVALGMMKEIVVAAR